MLDLVLMRYLSGMPIDIEYAGGICLPSFVAPWLISRAIFNED